MTCSDRDAFGRGYEEGTGIGIGTVHSGGMSHFGSTGLGGARVGCGLRAREFVSTDTCFRGRQVLLIRSSMLSCPVGKNEDGAYFVASELSTTFVSIVVLSLLHLCRRYSRVKRHACSRTLLVR